MCCCPSHDDRTPSLSLRQGDRAILVKCFAGCDRRAILRELRRIPLRGCPEPFQYRPSRAGNWSKIWKETRPLTGTLGENYLASRQLQATESGLRFHPRCPVNPKPFTTYPAAIIAAVRSDNGLVAIHRTFLDPETNQIARIDKPKRALGQPGAGAVRLGGKVTGQLGLAEGIESALSASKLFGVPCWATLGNERFGSVSIPDSVTELHLFIDADHGGKLAEKRARAAHARVGRRILTRPPPISGQDWNDVLMVRLRQSCAAV
ncbi:MAG: hypothetical protein B7X90_12615 [Novosphingobium sp. 17-62-19]|nr:MAG: hypothetical protein B7X90_12615 [Novosphingobium sp. 17-62-19]